MVMKGINAVNTATLKAVFNGSDPSIITLSNMISDGRLIDGMGPDGHLVSPEPVDEDKIGDHITTIVFAYSIPVLWRLSGRKPFVLDSGSSCDAPVPSGVYLTPDTQARTKVCYNQRLYFLVMSDGDPAHCPDCGKNGCDTIHCRPNQFSIPPGLEYLDGKDKTFGDITIQKIVEG